MSKTIRVVSSNRNGSQTEVKNVIAGVPTITNEIIESLGIEQIKDRITDLEQNFFQQATTPTTGVNEGDLWYDKTNDVLKQYREYPVGSTNYRWEVILYKDNDTMDGGTW